MSGGLGWSSPPIIGSRQNLNSLSAIPALEINGTQLNRVNFTKSLGVLIDENLTWSNHINAITKKILMSEIYYPQINLNVRCTQFSELGN